MAITIKYSGYTFEGSGENLLLLAPTSPPDMYEVWNPISEVLEWDTLTFGVKSDATGTKYIWTSLGEIYSTSSSEEYVIEDGDLMDYERGTPVQVYKDGGLIRTFYLDSITARRGGLFEFSCVSLVGLLDERYHKGGVYFGTAAEDIIDDIMDGAGYYIDADVAAITLYGWLPYDTARNNLAKVLFATGASLMKGDNGYPYFKFNQPTTSADVSANTFYDQDSSPVERFGTVQVIEHTFFNSASQTAEVLFDNRNSVAASNSLIIFDEPQASLNASGLTVSDSGANWAIVSGTGYLEGNAYIHIKRVINQATGVNASEVKEIAENGLISRLNSGNVLDRLVNYYGNAVTHQIATKHTSERAGSIISFPEISGRAVSGYVHTIDSVVSGFVKANMDVVTNWTPVGLGNQYSDYFILTAADLSGGTFTIPTAHRGKRALAVLFGGAQGGYGGMDGERGASAQWDTYSSGSINYARGYGGAGGSGGLGAPAGGGGRYLSAEITSLAASYAGSIGAGGAGGASCAYGEDFIEGDIGGDTVFAGFSTADGVVLEGPYINLIDGSVYGETGTAGTDGKAGGNGGDHLGSRNPGEAGEDYNTIWLGGAGGLAFRDGAHQGSGAGGGGAAYGSSAADVVQSTSDYEVATAGASATAPAQAGFYLGGNGGHGGGGGGGGAHYANGENFYTCGHGAAGGSGSVGGQGADGFILVYV